MKFSQTFGATLAREDAGRGFTLLELLIAVAIFAVVLLAMNGIFYNALRLRNASAQSIEKALPTQQALAIIKKDLQGIVPPGGPLAGSLQTGNSLGLPQQVQPGGGTAFYTCSATIDDTSPFSSVQRVSYYLKPSEYEAGRRDLVRGVTRNLLTTAVDIPVEQWLMTGVDQLQFAFYDGSTWRDTWDSSTSDTQSGQTNSLPKAIKVQIAMEVPLGERRGQPIELVVPLNVEARTNAVQNTGGTQ